MGSFSRFGSLICGLLIAITAVSATNNSTVDVTTGTISISAVQLTNETAFSVCVYPTSGSYSFLNRLIYYCTLVFALFSRGHLWLVAGALATAMTYAGVAAVHACLLAWIGPNPYEENDVWALSTILGTACLMTVPLLNWSGTLRRLGAHFGQATDRKALKTQRNVGTRTIVIYWAFLVLVGYISIWKAINFGVGDAQYPDMSKVICRAGTNASVFDSDSETWHRRAVDQAFVDTNGCNNPCSFVNIPSITKQNSDLVLLDHGEALLWTDSLTTKKYNRINRFLVIQDDFGMFNEMFILFVLLQGAITVCFGRRDPREIRDFIYIKLAMEHDLTNPALVALRDWSARILAFLSYLLAILIILVCPPLFVLLIIEQEWQSTWEIPDAESVSEIGQWGPWAVAVQVILAAFIARYHDSMIRLIAGGCRHVYQMCRKQQYEDLDEEAHQLDSQTPSDTTDPKVPHVSKRNASVVSIVSVSLTSDNSPATKSWQSSIGSSIRTLWGNCTRPLNQSGKGFKDEIQNFFHWCKDPARTSRIVVRHPIRSIDREEMVFDDDDSEKSQLRRGSGFFRAALDKQPHGKK